MKNLKYFALGCAALCAVTLSSCSDDEPSPSDREIVPEGEGKMEAMTLPEQLRFIQETAGIALSQLNPEDQKELLLNSAYAFMAYGDLKAPASWIAFAEKVKESIESSLQGSLPSTSPETKGATSVVYSVRFSDFTGVYTPGSESWEKTEDSDKIEFRFPGPDGQEETFVVTGSEKTFLYSFVEEKWEGNDVFYTSTAIYLPTTLTASYNVHGRSLASATLNYDVAKKADGTFDFNGKAELTAANLSSYIDLTATNRKYTAEYTVSINDNPALRGAALVNGNHLTDLQHIMLLTKFEDVAMLVKNAEAYVDIMGRIQINGSMTMTEKFFGMKPVVTALDGLAQSEAEKKTAEAAKILEKYIKVWLRFNGTQTEQSRLQWSTATRELPEGWVSTFTPLLYVPADNRTYNFAEFEEAQFAELIQSLATLVDSYKSLFGK